MDAQVKAPIGGVIGRLEVWLAFSAGRAASIELMRTTAIKWHVVLAWPRGAVSHVGSTTLEDAIDGALSATEARAR